MQIVTDRSFTDVGDPPLWYFINHGSQIANLRFEYDPDRNEFKWIAKSHIPKHAELFFNYNPGEKTTFENQEESE